MEYISKHYILHFARGSFAERNAEKIALNQEACRRLVCDAFRTDSPKVIHYYLYDTPEEVGRAYGDDEPCSGFARVPDKIYAVYNDRVKCIGFHEDAHLITESINNPPYAMLREGIAMYFDRVWWGIANESWTRCYINKGTLKSIRAWIDDDAFYEVSEAVSYPAAGAFTDYIIKRFGIDTYLKFWANLQSEAEQLFEKCFGISFAAACDDFIAYMNMFKDDGAVEKRMEEMLAK